MPRLLVTFSAAALLGAALAASAQTMQAPDITKQPTLYVVPYAHLDTQWRWEFPRTISEYLLKTMRVNFYYIDKYPHYVFNWTGSNRYRLMKEYYPADYATDEAIHRRGPLVSGRLVRRRRRRQSAQRRIDHPPGALWQHLLPQGIRQGQRRIHAARLLRLSRVAAHHPGSRRRQRLLHAKAQLRLAARAQRRRTRSPEKTPEGIPFNVGVWEGPDGETVIAALNPGGYGSRIRYRPQQDARLPARRPNVTRSRRLRRKLAMQDWVTRIAIDGKVTGVFADYHYVGTGDIGGATDEESVKLLEAMVTKGRCRPCRLPTSLSRDAGQPASSVPKAPVHVGDGPVHVISASRRPDVPRHQA